MSQNLTREEFLKLVNQVDPDQSKLDDLDEKALQGFQYLDAGETPEDVLARLDSRFEEQQLTGTKNRKIETKVFSVKRIQRLAAVLLLLLIPAYFIFKGPSSDRLFVTNFEAPRSTYFQQTRGATGDSELDAAFKQAFQSYEMGNYEKAMVAIEQLAATHPDKPDLVFYQALAALGAGHSEEAIALFKDCLEIDYQDVNIKAPWYLALSYLKLGDKSQAIQWLNTTMEIDDRHRPLAEALIKDLN